MDGAREPNAFRPVLLAVDDDPDDLRLAVSARGKLE
jgi:hypothetical protein